MAHGERPALYGHVDGVLTALPARTAVSFRDPTARRQPDWDTVRLVQPHVPQQTTATTAGPSGRHRQRRIAFYRSAVAEFIHGRDAAVLVVAGEQDDRDVFASLGFADVVISNLGTRIGDDQFLPYRASHQDAHRLTFADQSFDFVVVHDGLHHCASPHRALLEMYRVARRGVLVIESRDSLLMRIAGLLGLTAEYEPAAIHEGHGGVNNTEIPNFVFRWTEREIKKTVAAYAPHVAHRYEFRYGWSPPVTPAVERHSHAKRAAILIGMPIYWAVTRLFPKQQNHFAIYVEIPMLPLRLQPWLELHGDDLRFKRSWGRRYQTGPEVLPRPGRHAALRWPVRRRDGRL